MKRDDQCMRIRIFFGIFLIYINMNLALFDGNLTTYMYSTFFSLSIHDSDLISPTRMISVRLISIVLIGLPLDIIRRRIGLAFTAAFGILLTSCGSLLTYFTVSKSVWTTMLVYQVIGGVGHGIVNPIMVLYMEGWFPASCHGVIFAMVTMSCGVGGLLYNYILTAYINPENVDPDVTYQGLSYFSQVEIIDRVPTGILLVGLVATVSQLVGFALLKTPIIDNADPSHDSILTDNAELNNSIQKLSPASNLIHAQSKTNTEFYYTVPQLPTKEINAIETIGINPQSAAPPPLLSSLSRVQEWSSSSSPMSSKSSSIGESILSTSSVLTASIEESEKKTVTPIISDKTPCDSLRTKAFYLVWLSTFTMSMGDLISTSYYKMYGQIWIHDDHFLATVGSLSAVFYMLSKPFFGLIMDKWGVKIIIMIHLGTLAVLTSSWYFTAMVSRWWYLVWTVVITAMYNNLDIFLPVSILKLFGKTHYGSNTFLVQSAIAISMIVTPTALSFLMDVWSWFGLFSLCFTTSFVSFIIVTFYMPSDSV